MYNKILDACALSADLKMLPAGELTEIGEKVRNLHLYPVSISKDRLVFYPRNAHNFVTIFLELAVFRTSSSEKG